MWRVGRQADGVKQQEALGLSHGMGWTAQGGHERGETSMEGVCRPLSRVGGTK